MGEDTQEFLVGRAIEKRKASGGDRKRFNRRSAYLFIWGNVYGIFGTLLLIASQGFGADNVIFGTLFVAVGATSVLASLRSSEKLDVTAFTLLAGTAAAEGFWSLFDPSRPVLISVLAGVLWLGVAGAQVVVAGWPLGYAPPPPSGSSISDRVRGSFVLRPRRNR